MSKLEEVRLGLETAYIDGTVASNSVYRPQFIYNDNKNGQKVFSAIEDELHRCNSFTISVTV